MNADPQVMRYFPSMLTEEETDALGGTFQVPHQRD